MFQTAAPDEGPLHADGEIEPTPRGGADKDAVRSEPMPPYHIAMIVRSLARPAGFF